MIAGASMTLEEIKEAFDRAANDGSNDMRADLPPGPKDLAAFCMLHFLECFKDKHRVVTSAEHDEIWVDVDMEQFQKVATVELIWKLSALGLSYDSRMESFYMFV